MQRDPIHRLKHEHAKEKVDLLVLVCPTLDLQVPAIRQSTGMDLYRA